MTRFETPKSDPVVLDFDGVGMRRKNVKTFTITGRAGVARSPADARAILDGEIVG